MNLSWLLWLQTPKMVKEPQPSPYCAVSGATVIRTAGTCEDHIFGLPYSSLGEWLTSVRPNFGFGIGNQNQGPISVSVSEPKFFFPKPKLLKNFSFFPTSWTYRVSHFETDFLNWLWGIEGPIFFFDLWCLVASGGADICVSSTSFQKNDIG